MTARWTSEQVASMAPDAASAKAARKLAAPHRWLSLARGETAAWGEYQGSGRDPYRTQIELAGPAFKCSCPSRKFPCKHALALMYLLVEHPDALRPQDPPPDWVSDWLARRARRAQASPASGPATPAARAKTRAKRRKTMAAGLEELERWLRDLARQGLATVEGQPYRFWETMAARMVDAQAPAVARQLRDLAGLPGVRADWPEQLLRRLGRLYLLAEGLKRLDQLPPPAQADLRSALGWALRQEDLAQGQAVHDRWLVLGRRVEELEAKLRLQRTWLWGTGTGRMALSLEFAHRAGKPFESVFPPGLCLEADLLFYPSGYPLRAALQEPYTLLEPPDGPTGHLPAAGALAAYAQALAQNPWVDPFPMPLQAVVPLRQEDGWLVCDETGGLPLRRSFQIGWHLMALSGGSPLALFGEWDGDGLLPLSAWAEGRLVDLEAGPG